MSEPIVPAPSKQPQVPTPEQTPEAAVQEQAEQAVVQAAEQEAKQREDAEATRKAAVKGKGVELVITLGTGFGTALYLDGKLAPHLELAHHPFRKGESYEEQLGNPARKDVGGKKWNKRVQRAIETLRLLVHFDHLYIGGGNAKKLSFTPIPTSPSSRTRRGSGAGSRSGATEAA